MQTKRNNMPKSYIDPELYKEIRKNISIPCVDAVVVHKGKFLLGKRVNKPAKGEWWFPGGRMLVGEKFEEAVSRKIKQETGLIVETQKFLALETWDYPDGPDDIPTHSIACVFKATVASSNPKLEQQHSGLEWFSKIDPKWNPYVKRMLEKAGFR